MKSRSARLVTFALTCTCAALFASGCASSAPGGGAAPTPCAIPADCPGNLVCENNVCRLPYAADTSGADTITGDTTATLPDVQKDAGTETAQPDTEPAPDAVAEDTPGATDVSTPDTQPEVKVDVQPDVQAEVTPSGPMTIQQIQSAATSMACDNPQASVIVAQGVELESAIVVSKPGKVDKLQSFFVVPAVGVPSAVHGALQVLVYGGTVALEAGDVVLIKGDVKEFYCMTELTAAAVDVQLAGKAPVPAPLPVPLVKMQPSAAEPYESALVQLNDVYVVNPNPLGDDGKTHGEFTIGIDAGTPAVSVGPSSFTTFAVKNAATEQMETKYQVGQFFSSITGNLTYSFGHWVLRPRNDADLVP